MQLLCELLVRVGLDAQGLVDRQDLEQEGKLILISIRNLFSEESLVVADKVE
jgi:hypothetical protein